MDIRDRVNFLFSLGYGYDLRSLGSSDISLLSYLVQGGMYLVLIPDSIRLRGDYMEMKSYRLVKLIWLYEFLYSGMGLGLIYDSIRYSYGIFLSDRQFQNLTRLWRERYSIGYNSSDK